MKKVFLVIKKILLILWWQDIEKSNLFVRILNYIWAFTLSFGAFSLVYLSNMNLILKIIIGSYLILNFMSFWPTSNLLDDKDEVEGGIFYIFQRIFVLFSFVIILKHVINEEK